MPSPTDPGRLLFVYGSLLQPTGIAFVDEALKRWTRPLGPAFIHGRLYSLGTYPGVKPAPRGVVKGRLLLLADPKKALAALDRYEEFDPRAPGRSEFVRAPVEVLRPGRRAPTLAQTYFYNRGVRGKRPIASGDYLAWRRARKITALPGREHTA